MPIATELTNLLTPRDKLTIHDVISIIVDEICLRK